MAFRKKAAVILKHKPDILVVPECEHPDKFGFDGRLQPSDWLWFGNNLNKGLGIFSYGRFRLRVRRGHNPDFKTIIPVSVNDGRVAFTLYAVWAWNPHDPDGKYVEQVWKALNYYDRRLTKAPVILAGDFNSNTIWDKKFRIGNHSHVVKRLEEKKIYSAYHLHHKQTQGAERHATLYMYRHKDKPYHIDYCFLSADLAARVESVKIGSHRFWTRFSDHVPVMVNIADE